MASQSHSPRDIFTSIDDFNLQLIERNWLGKMLFGQNQSYRIKILTFIINIIEKNINEIPKGNVLIPVHEILKIIKDFSGKTLLNYLNESFRDASSELNEQKKSMRDDFLNQKEKKTDDIIQRCQSIILEKNKMPTYSPSSSTNHDNQVQDDSQFDLSNQDINEISEGKKIKYARDYVNELLKSNIYFDQIITYKRSVFLILLNCFARSKGILLHEKGMEIDHQIILKKIYDLLVIASPILWPEIMNWLKNDTNPETQPIFPSMETRHIVISWYQRLVSPILDDILCLQNRIFKDDSVLPTIDNPIDDMLSICYEHAMQLINGGDQFMIKYEK